MMTFSRIGHQSKLFPAAPLVIALQISCSFQYCCWQPYATPITNAKRHSVFTGQVVYDVLANRSIEVALREDA